MDFEWDEAKRRANIRKHGVDFFDAAAIFENDIFELADDRDDYGEERWVAIGHVDGTVYRVVYTMRFDVIRIISAQRANRRDRERYYQEILSRRD
ncbi:MAG: BrnT family toxin [Sphingopyxis terrae]|nr:MAG: BrnT family toxin [Sphingopyxis terrae]PWB83828.1 MAG: BrnT family toxin [Methylocystaceae bacterium]